MILDPEDEAFNDIERQAKQRKEVVLAAINKEKPMKDEKAFPNPHLRDDSGMTLRDYFAASFVSSGHVFKSISDGNTPELVAEQAYMMADAMLKAREA
jgi:hypothetical protein